MALNITGNGTKECYLQEHSIDNRLAIDAVVYKQTEIAAGDEIYHRISQYGAPVLNRVDEVVERRPSKGDWSRAPHHMDWVRLRISPIEQLDALKPIR